MPCGTDDGDAPHCFVTGYTLEEWNRKYQGGIQTETQKNTAVDRIRARSNTEKSRSFG